MSEKLLISVVIATYNRSSILKETLQKLDVQSVCPDDFEVLVLDDGSSDDTWEMTASLTTSLRYRLRYFQHENRGPGFTQNRGIKQARAKLVLLLADDIWPTPQLLEQHLTAHTENPEENIAVLGKVVPSTQLPKTVMHKHWDAFRHEFSRCEGKREVDSLFFLACNISVKKQFLLQEGMFRERQGAAVEDIELGYRLGRKGLRILYNQLALGYHYHPETLPKACQRGYETGLNFDLVSDHVPKSIIFPFYRIISFEAGFFPFIRMFPRLIARKCLFNKWLVNCFWFPILQHAEISRFAALFANGITYRGVVGYYFHKGYKDTLKKRAPH
ncbi:MAG: glycosyltransferase family 2 protein [Promethearchaeota archaeon]|jgi:glycosyltransferase involved in cell wall biosynthesis